ncbi:MAG TPA: insulinase family protein, partial [Polyangiaceae bacterium]|nr:insulinase family protein [Polyangiaceae bacterium]
MVTFNVGSDYRGFRVQRTAEVELMRSLAVEFEHEASGARVLHVKNDDTENLFSVTFPTVPADDTGVPHILEHSVLAGSQRYPHKDSFMELYRSSAATFINAMTAGDHTLYPVSSTVPRDLFTLADVYFDSVFHPLLSEHTFRREGHRLELVTKEGAESELCIKGIVYSEMRGAYSSVESLLYRERDRALFPDTLYGR